MRNTLLLIVFTIPILVLVSCSSIPSTHSTTSQMLAEPPANTFTPSPTATTTPNLTATQKAVDLQETQIAKETQNEIFTQDTQIAQEATAQVEATQQAEQDKLQEQIDAFYTEAEKAGIVINKNPEFIQNNSDILSVYFSDAVLEGKNIKKIVFNKEYQDNLGYYDLAKVAGVMRYLYKENTYATIRELSRGDPAGRNVFGYTNYGRTRFQGGLTFPVSGTTITGQEVKADITHIEYQLVKKQEFDQLLTIARQLELPVITNIDKIHSAYQAMVYFQGNKMVSTTYDKWENLGDAPKAAWPFEQINTEISQRELFGSFHLTHRAMIMGTLCSLMYNNSELTSRLPKESVGYTMCWYNCYSLDAGSFCENVSDDLAQTFQ